MAANNEKKGRTVTSPVEGLEVKSYVGSGYDRTHIFGTWCVAYLNNCDEYTVNTMMERHVKSDEVFVLLKGTATLYIGRDRTPVPMELHKIYNVTAGTWHNITCSTDASVLIAENSDTDKTNTDYFQL